MRLTIRAFGLDLLDIELTTDQAEEYDEPGDCTTQPIGFVASPGDQRWEQAPDFGE